MHIKLNEQNQTIEYPPINKDNICNYNVATDLLEADGFINVEQSLIDLFNQGKGKIENGAIVDISNTKNYKEKIKQKENNIIKKQIEELDLKRIRAIAEPSVKDEATGGTWLEYYTQQIQNLRSQLL